MIDLDLNAARDRLDARRRELLARARRARELADEELDSREIEMVENAAELWDARVLSSVGNAASRSLRSVRDALRRLEDGRYGRCEICGAEIEQERLVAVPETDRCLGCAVAT
jgi:DnaK suppressor protein